MLNVSQSIVSVVVIGGLTLSSTEASIMPHQTS